MTLSEFKLWFDGFKTGLCGDFSSTQFSVLRQKIEEIEDDGTMSAGDFQKASEFLRTIPEPPAYAYPKLKE